MISQLTVLNAVNAVLAEDFPGVVVYRDHCPEDFKRPSFFLQNISRKIADVNFCTVKITHNINISYADVVDAHYEADTDRLLLAMDTIMALFEGKRLAVLDRSLAIIFAECKRQADVANVSLTIEFFDDKTQVAEDLPTVADIEMEGL